MELTQIQGETPGKKLNLTPVNPLNVGSGDGSQISHPELPPKAATISMTPEGERTIAPVKSSPVVLNGKQISGPTQISHGDTIGIGKGNPVVIGAHKPGENLSPVNVGERLGTMNFNPQQISEITHKLFDYRANKAIQKPLTIAIAILIMLTAGIVYGFFKISKINDDLVRKAASLEGKIANAQTTIQDFESVLGVSIDGDEECDDEFEDCSTLTQSSLDTRINNINKSLGDISKRLTEATKSSAKVEASVLASINTALKGSGSELLQDLIIKRIKEDELSKFAKSISDIQKNFDSLNIALGDEVQSMTKDIKSITDYSEDLRSLKTVKSFMNDFESENAVVDKRIKLIETDIQDNKKEISGSIKKGDDLDTQIKKLNEELDVIEIRIKELEKR